MAFAAFLSLLLWAYHLFLIAGLLRMCEFQHVSPLNISIVSLSAQICHAQLHQGDQANHQRIPSRRPPVEICGIAQRGSNGAQASPTSTRSQRSARLVAHSSSTPGLWWIPKISCPEDDTEALGGSIWAAWDGILHGILMGCTTGLANS